MKKLIVLSGVGDCGKTSTLNEVIKKLESKGGVVNKLRETNPRTKPNPDVTAIIEINGKKIIVITVGDAKRLIEQEIKRVVGVTTAGDTQAQIESGFNLLSGFDCDIIICSSRTKGDGFKFVEDLARQNGMEFTRIYKQRAQNDDSSKANEIIKKANL